MQLKTALKISAGMASEPGPNEQNDDCLGVRIPEGLDLSVKGIAAVIADGVSAAEAGKQAAEICVQGFLNDYYDAPEAWTVKTCGTKVTQSLNRWLYGLGQSHSSDGRGYVSTFTALVLKGETGYLFHVGDSRLYRWRSGEFEQLTRDHSFRLGKGGSGLARAMGMDTDVEVEMRSFSLQAGDRFLLTTDGIHGFVTDKDLESQVGEVVAVDKGSLDDACSRLCSLALENGGNDNCSALLMVVESVGSASLVEHEKQFKRLPFPPDLAPGMKVDGFEIEKELQATSRSQTYLAKELATGRWVVMKTPSVYFEDDVGYIERFIMEGWIGRKLRSEHLVASVIPPRGQQFLYTVLEFIDGLSLEEWIKQNPKPNVREVIGYAKQLLRGLRAMHRQEMLHQDLKPSNVILHPERGAVIIDYGSTNVAGIHEIATAFERERPLGTLGYSAPEYFLNRKPSRKSDLFSLGVIVYEALTGKLPYGEAYERCQTVRDFSVLSYRPATQFNSMVPVWLDGALRKAVSINPQMRYESYSEFEYDLEHPNPRFLPDNPAPFIERNPLLFWKLATLIGFSSLAGTWIWILTH